MIRRGKVGAFAGAIAIAWPLVAAGQDALDEARRLWQTGKYDEAVDAYEAVRTVTPETDAPKRAAATRGKALALASLGKYGNAAAELKKLTEGPKPDTESLAILADLSFDRGAWDEAERLAKQAIALEPDQLRARFTLVELDLARGRKEPAVEQAKWFIDHHNANEPKLAKDPEALLLIGQAAEKYYRATAEGEDLSESLGEVLSTLYERAIQVDPRCWQAAWLQGRLFLSGYDEAKAQKELQRALRINPSAPEVLVTMGTADLQGYKLSAGRRRAEDALEINPHYVPARILLADLNISDERFDEAQKESQAALAENPRNEEALARLAASCRLLVDSQGAAVAEARALAQNPHPVAFYSALGERLADRRKYHSAERAHLLAIAADPKAAVPRLGLGMLYMQIGREDEANDLFETAFASDPFNVRADNMRKVLRHLAAYDAIETDHFIVKTQPGPDALVGRYMARYLEQVHDELAAKFGFTPRSKS
jgi:tetratricopeptide (TPR) repeat protein